MFRVICKLLLLEIVLIVVVSFVIMFFNVIDGVLDLLLICFGMYGIWINLNCRLG